MIKAPPTAIAAASSRLPVARVSTKNRARAPTAMTSWMMCFADIRNLLPRLDSNQQRQASKACVLPIELLGTVIARSAMGPTLATFLPSGGAFLGLGRVSLAGLMGSLIKKRRKRMRKKKHRKLLKRTRIQRRNK